MKPLLTTALLISLSTLAMPAWSECVRGNCYNGFGVEKQPFDGPRYNGSFLNGDYHGKGVMTYSDGGSYDGDWVKGINHGKGVMTFANGLRYEGEFVNGQIHGKGALTAPDGSVLEAIWENNKPVREIIKVK